MKNELFRRLQQSSPHLAQWIADNPEAMQQLDELEVERVVVELGQLLQEAVPGLIVEQRNVG